MRLKGFLEQPGDVPASADTSSDAAREAERLESDCLAIVEREVRRRYPLAGPFLTNYRRDARQIVRLVIARARGRESGAV